MPGGNLELARQAAANLQALAGLLDEEVVLDTRGYSLPDDVSTLDASVHIGRDAVVRELRSYVGTWADFDFGVEGITDAGGDVILDIRETGRGRASGVPMEHRYAQVWRFRDGRIVRIESYQSRGRALRALGLEGQATDRK